MTYKAVNILNIKKVEKTALFEFGRYNSNNKFKHFGNWPIMCTY